MPPQQRHRLLDLVIQKVGLGRHELSNTKKGKEGCPLDPDGMPQHFKVLRGENLLHRAPS
jgi:hypothetical protein